MEAPEPRTFYRVVESNPPTDRDFLSYAALGRPLRKLRPSAAEIAAWRAVSTYVTEEAARGRARANAALGFPLGDFIAKLVIPEDAPVAIGRINSKTGHCNLTGEASVLRSAVVSVVSV